MLKDKNYEFIENPFVLSRRQFIAISGLLTALALLPVALLRTAVANRNHYIIARSKGLYQDDTRSKNRVSHNNSAVKKLYAEFAGQPLSELSEHLFHTTYVKRSSTSA